MNKAVGVVLDVSLRHIDGTRLIDEVKDQLCKFVSSFIDDDDAFYLFHPILLDSVYSKGEIVSCLQNYETDGWSFDVAYALRQTFYVLEAESCDSSMLILVTDRMIDPSPIEKLLVWCRKMGIECEFVVVGTGESFSFQKYQDFPQLRKIFSPNPQDISDRLSEALCG